MTEFSSTAGLVVELDERSLRRAKQRLESELSIDPVPVEATGGSTMGSLNGGGRGGGGTSQNLGSLSDSFDDQTNALRDITGHWEENIDLNKTRNELLRELLEETEDQKFRRRSRVGRGGGGGLLGGGLLAALGLAAGAASKLKVPELPKLKAPEIPPLKAPEIPELDIDGLSGDGGLKGLGALGAGAAGAGAAKLLGQNAPKALAGGAGRLGGGAVFSEGMAPDFVKREFNVGDETVKPFAGKPFAFELFDRLTESGGQQEFEQQRVNPTGQAQERAQANLPEFRTMGLRSDTVQTISEARQTNGNPFRDDIRRRGRPSQGSAGGDVRSMPSQGFQNRAREARDRRQGGGEVNVEFSPQIDASSIRELRRDLERRIDELERQLGRLGNGNSRI